MYTFAIVGCGHIAHRHAENIVKQGRLTAVCDTDTAKADAFARKYGAKSYHAIDTLLKEEKELDIISVCTPNGLHAEHSIKAIQAGKHVLCEKPLCITSVAAWQMRDASHFFRKRLFVVKQNRYNPPVMAVKSLLDAGKLGKITGFQINCFWNRSDAYYAQSDWRGTPELDGGTLYTQFSHFIDLLYWFLGDMETALAVRENYSHASSVAFEDSGAVILTMKSGATGTLQYTINSFNKNMEGSITLFGERGTVKIGGQYLNTLAYFEVEGEAKPALDENTAANQYGFYEGSMSNHDKVYGNVIEALQNNSSSYVEAAEAAKTIEMIEKIYAAGGLRPETQHSLELAG